MKKGIKMKREITILVVFFSMIMMPAFPQEKSRRESRDAMKMEKIRQTEALVNSREFVFIGRMAYPQGYRSVDLTTNANYLKFHPDFIESEMPFFGKAYSGIGYGGSDTGLKFKGEPQEYNVTVKKNGYLVTAVVKGERDVYRISLSVGDEGGASLSITSNNRSSISYNGEIYAPEKAKR